LFASTSKAVVLKVFSQIGFIFLLKLS